MSEPEESVDERLDRLARATEPLRPRPGFEARVMAAIQAELPWAPGWLGGVVSMSRRALATAGLMAAAGLGLAVMSERSANESVAASFAAAEVEPIDVTETEAEIEW